MPRRWYLLPCRTFQPVVVTTQSLPNGTQGTAYSFQWSANGGTPPYTWSLVSDTGTNTWTISASGLLTGTPANAETDTITAKVTDAVGGVALSAPLSLVVTASGSTYNFLYFIAPSNGGTLGNDLNDGLAPVFTGNGGRQPTPSGHGPWTIGSLLNSQTANLHPTATQIANNALMAAKNVGIVGDQGVVSLADAGITYPTVYGGNANVLSAPSGTATAQTVLAPCNSSGQYVRGLAVLDGNLSVGTFQNGLTTTNIISSYDFIGRSDTGTNCQYITVDGLVIQNCINAGICFRQAGPLGTTLPGWVAINNTVRNVYNCNEGAICNGVSQDTTGKITIGAIVRGVIHVNASDGDIILTAGFGPTGTKITSQISGAPGGAGVYQSSLSTTTAVPGPVNGFAVGNFSGNNLAGISFHGGLNLIQTNNYIQDVIDLNDILLNNQRSIGIKNWASNGATVTNNTIYASSVSGQPGGGIAFKNVPQFNYTIANNYINCANCSVVGTGDTNGIQGDGDQQTVTSPNGHFATINNNIIVPAINGLSAFPVDVGGGNTQALLVNCYNNTMVGVGSAHANWFRFGPVNGSQTLTYHDNIIHRTTPASDGNGGDWRTQVTNVIQIGHNVWPSNYVLNTVPAAGGSGTVYKPAQNGGLAAAMASLVGATYDGIANDETVAPTYVTASLTNFVVPASAWQLAIGSSGKGTGTGGSDKGAWGGGATQIGCNFKDPSG